MNVNEVIKELKKKSNQKDKEGMARFGIETNKALGVRVWELRKMAKEIGKDHDLALDLWGTDIHEARMLATMVDDPKEVTEKQMDEWVSDFNSWDICDQCCGNLFDKTPYLHKKILEWTKDEQEFVRRAGFVLIATSAVHRKDWEDKDFERYFSLIEKYSDDNRNFVKKAVNWSLRQVGKRNKTLNKKCVSLAKKIQKRESKSAKWIARDAIRELESENVQKRLNN
ncbi:MAG: DNA alkylation repair protein [Candidatus Aenigmarchaeota archaeon]|nr:DNA alkylation repair protein [Candidatus Aenigmarchaeota archaeon]